MLAANPFLHLLLAVFDYDLVPIFRQILFYFFQYTRFFIGSFLLLFQLHFVSLCFFIFFPGTLFFTICFSLLCPGTLIFTIFFTMFFEVHFFHYFFHYSFLGTLFLHFFFTIFFELHFFTLVFHYSFLGTLFLHFFSLFFSRYTFFHYFFSLVFSRYTFFTHLFHSFSDFKIVKTVYPYEENSQNESKTCIFLVRVHFFTILKSEK